MPCHTPEPDQHHIATRRAAKLLVYVNTVLGKETEKKVHDLANNAFAYDPEIVPRLCRTLSDLPAMLREAIVYNSRSREARDLANWWEDHLEADKRRQGDA